MPNKRTSIDQQTNGDSDLFSQDGDVKRARLGSWRETTFEDLPFELIESILIKAIVMEVKGLNLANSVWKEKADLVISRLCTVCSQWSNILKTNLFRNELHRSLASAQKTTRLEILHQSQIQNIYLYVTMATIKDEIFLFVHPPLQGLCIDVYDRNNMAVVKDVIPLKRLCPYRMVACSVSNCLYILNRVINTIGNRFSVLRIARGKGNRFTVKPLIEDLCLPPQAGICVSPNGNLILMRKQTKRIDAVTVYDANGYVLHTVRLATDIKGLFDRISVTSNGNLVLVQANGRSRRKVEVSMNGDVIREYHSSTHKQGSVCDADNNGRVLISDHANRMELLDSEFNLMEFCGPPLTGGQFTFLYAMSYNVNRNELVAITGDRFLQNGLLTIFRFL